MLRAANRAAVDNSTPESVVLTGVFTGCVSVCVCVCVCVCVWDWLLHTKGMGKGVREGGT
jgi:hypothetical protein